MTNVECDCSQYKVKQELQDMVQYLKLHGHQGYS